MASIIVLYLQNQNDIDEYLKQFCPNYPSVTYPELRSIFEDCYLTSGSLPSDLTSEFFSNTANSGSTNNTNSNKTGGRDTQILSPIAQTGPVEVVKPEVAQQPQTNTTQTNTTNTIEETIEETIEVSLPSHVVSAYVACALALNLKLTYENWEETHKKIEEKFGLFLAHL